jgi:hypothetical protein
MTYTDAVSVLRSRYPRAVVQKVWHPRAPHYRYRVISQPVEWFGSLDGHFAHVELCGLFPKLTLAVIAAAERIEATA